MSKIDVITVKLVCHIPVTRSDRQSVATAYNIADDLAAFAKTLGETIVTDQHLNRVPAPPPASPPPPAETLVVDLDGR